MFPMSQSWPSVSVVLPAAKAEAVLPNAIASIRRQDYPGPIEIVVASADDTTAMAGRQAIVIPNPGGSTPAGLNLGWRAASGEVIVRCDAQATLPEGYVRRAIETMQRTKAHNVGGRQIPLGSTPAEAAVARAMASPLGAGNARYRVGGAEGPVETVYLGVYPRQVLETLGGFDEDFVRTQDYELNHRIRAEGGVVWFDPQLEVSYRPRGTLGELVSQYFQYGQAKRRFARKHPGSLRPRQLGPPMLVGALVISFALAYPLPWLLGLPALYLAAILIEGFRGRFPIRTAAALAAMHLSWGVGFALGPVAGSSRYHQVEIITTAHWEGDARLRRHVDYLTRIGVAAVVTSFRGEHRVKAVLSAVRRAVTTRAATVIYPDPEMFALGPIVSRLKRRRGVIDIHEDYPLVAAGRSWVPKGLVWLIAGLARAMTSVGRGVADQTMTAAEHISKPTDVVVLNLPEPASLGFNNEDRGTRIVYVGSVSDTRGAEQMVDVVAGLPPSFELDLIGPVAPATRSRLETHARERGVSTRINLLGQLSHRDAWKRASTALAGLSLLQPVPAYERAIATKLWEYMAVGVVPVVSDLLGQKRLVEQIDQRLIAASAAEACEVIQLLADQPALRHQMAVAGRVILEEAWRTWRPDLAVQGVVSP